MRMNSAARLSAACALVVVFAVGAHAQQKPCVTASKFGPDDQIGNLNYMTPAKTLAASKLVTRGKAYRLGIETNKDTPRVRHTHVRDNGAAAGPGGRGDARPYQNDV
jgi:hypothetical protein